MDAIGVISASPSALTDKNLYAYCDNNPVMRTDFAGALWESFWDAASLLISADEVADNPTDFWAWAGFVGDLVDVFIPFVGGIGETTRALKAASDAADIVSDVKKGWKVGDDITNLTRAGNVPSWSTLRSRYWKNQAFYNPLEYDDFSLSRMKRGLAPIGEDGFSLELHHPYGRVGDNYYVFKPLTKTQHYLEHYRR